MIVAVEFRIELFFMGACQGRSEALRNSMAEVQASTLPTQNFSLSFAAPRSLDTGFFLTAG